MPNARSSLTIYHQDNEIHLSFSDMLSDPRPDSLFDLNLPLEKCSHIISENDSVIIAVADPGGGQRGHGGIFLLYCRLLFFNFFFTEQVELIILRHFSSMAFPAEMPRFRDIG